MLHWHLDPLPLFVANQILHICVNPLHTLGFCIPWCSLCPFQRMLKASETLSYALSLLHICAHCLKLCIPGRTFPAPALTYQECTPLLFLCFLHTFHAQKALYFSGFSLLGCTAFFQSLLLGCILWRAPIPSWAPILWWAPIPWWAPILSSGFIQYTGNSI